MRDIRTEIERINEVVSFPTIVAEILHAISSERVTIPKIAHLIETDAAMTTKILRVVNSPFYGLRGTVKSAADAVKMLGLDETGRFLLAYHMKSRVFAMNPQQSRRLKKMWEHSVSTATVARFLAVRANVQTAGKEYTAGVLHEMGKLVLIQYFPDTVPVVEQMIADLAMTDIEAENQIAAISHAEIGSELGEKWGLPPEFTEVMRCHHAAKTAEVNPLLVSIVRCADILCEQLGHGIGERSTEFSIQEDESFDILQQTIPYFGETDPAEIKAAIAADLEANAEYLKLIA
ncbi:MAG: HDOD domain-containing protein [Ignavibacteriales bacterium]|nr:HDOD domain-containing protein [Ignavibacteriales bacterium]